MRYINSIEQRINDGDELLDSVDQAILAKAFWGELVPLDPNDESTLVFLEQVKAKRVTITSKRKRRKLKNG